MPRRLGVAAALVDGMPVSGDVVVEDGRVAEVGRAPAGRHGLAVPGFVDLHVHGCGGVDFLTADHAAWRRGLRSVRRGGTTAFRPAFITAPPDQLVAVLRRLADMPADGPRLLGAHLEGPFLAANRMGVHDPRHRRDPDLELLARLLAAGPVGQVTLAPELPGALDLVTLLVGQGITVSIGHTDANAAQARAAFAAGARGVTHLCNAMRPLHHRDPGAVGAALTADEVTIEIIVDGHHLDDDMVRLVWRCAGGRIALVTDGTAAAGMPDGTYDIGGRVIAVEDGAVRDRHGALAGSTLTMIDAVRNLHALGVDLPSAVTAATRVPADVAGHRELGRLHPGAVADVVVLDDRLAVRETYIAGDPAHAG